MISTGKGQLMSENMTLYDYLHGILGFKIAVSDVVPENGLMLVQKGRVVQIIEFTGKEDDAGVLPVRSDRDRDSDRDEESGAAG